MKTPAVEKYRSSEPPWEIFRRIYASSRECFFLDSSRCVPPDQVYSYLGTDPVLSLKIVGETLYVNGPKPAAYPSKKIFTVLRKLLGEHRAAPSGAFPFFTGGLVGYWGYEMAELCDTVRFASSKERKAPKLWLGLFRHVIVFDHRKKVYFLTSYGRTSLEQRLGLEKLRSYFEGTRPRLWGQFRAGKVRPGMTERQFRGMVTRAKAYIAAGDIYQANLSQRFSFRFSGPALELYGKLREINPSPFSCFLKIRGMEVISSSPEGLIRKKGRICETRPIAGTCPAFGPRRGVRMWRKKLLGSDKEKAEHLMLVDLERNDLGRVCDYRTVRVGAFMALEKYSHVVHIVSKISGRLKKGKDALDLLRAMFPGGTITGCPKIRCMEIIDELEPCGRGLYTGSIGYIDFCGDMDLNIVIRTLILTKGLGHLQVGAGIVHDSIPRKEYSETLHKAQALIKALRETHAP
ncbi:MAG: anthranilate synthase component I family protein [Candidatus Omnitrophica bacterium]|nr:anthranilate synthase component I family protein [Candidatus Omnitrophota bacterium]